MPARPRVDLRPPVLGDRDRFLAAMRASRAMHRPWITGAATAEKFDAMLRSVEDERSDATLAFRREDGAIVGFFNISEIVRGLFNSAYLGYGGIAEHAGRGYMTEAMQLLLARAFIELRLHRLEANIQPANVASIALVRRAAFVREGFSQRYLKVGGRWRDHERWAIRAEQWRA